MLEYGASDAIRTASVKALPYCIAAAQKAGEYKFSKETVHLMAKKVLSGIIAASGKEVTSETLRPQIIAVFFIINDMGPGFLN